MIFNNEKVRTNEKRIIPYIDREVIPPPNQPNEILSHQASLKFLKQTPLLSRGAKILAASLLRDGDVVQFPDGMGLDYERVFKMYVDPQEIGTSFLEMIDDHDLKSSVDAIIVPEYSAIVPGTIMTTLLNKPVVRLRKNGIHEDEEFAAQIKSYTGGGIDTLFLSKKILDTLKKKEKKDYYCLMIFLIQEV